MSQPSDILVCLRFLTRLPVPAFPHEAAPHRPLTLARMTWAMPVAGALIGVVAAVVFGGARAAGLPLMVAALLAVMAEIVITGALHEDGLADCADALGAYDRDKRLAIMRDSRIGTFGALALVFSVLLRVLLIAAADAPVAGLIVAAAASRAAMLALPVGLAPARSDGLGAGAGLASRSQALAAAGAALVLALLLLPWGGWRMVLATFAALAAGLALVPAVRRAFGGFSGDTIGAAQQVSLVAFWLVAGAH